MSPRMMLGETTSNEKKEVDVKKEGDPKEEEEGEAQEVVDENRDDTKPKQKKYENWPLRDVKEPHENDVLYGRGGGTNHHPGNKRYRKMVEERKMDYVTSKRLDKPLVALEIIRFWRDQDPPGRFLKIDERTGLWHDVGDKKAREKTSQALREKAPQLRKEHEGEDDDDYEESDEEAGKTKTTRFAEGTNDKSNNVKKAVLARDHSLGREYLEPGVEVTLEGFSWQDPLQEVDAGRTGSQGSFRMGSQGSFRVGSQGSLPPDPYYPPGHMNSYGSMGVPHPNYHQSHGSCPYPDYPGRNDGPHSRYIASGRYESWGEPMSSTGSNGPPMPPPPMQYGGPYPHHMSSGQMSSGSWAPHRPNTARENSLSRNPLRHATTSQPAVGFDSRGGSGYWPDGPPQQAYGHPPEPYRSSSDSFPPQQAYGHPPEPYHSSSDSVPPQQPYGHPPDPYRSSPDSMSSANHTPPRGPSSYSVDPSIAQTWSSQSDDYDKFAVMEPPEVPRTWSGEEYDRRQAYRLGHRYGGFTSKHGGDVKGELARPQTVKRATSNQNENVETKPDLKGPSVKRAALNRDNSLASNRLKAAYLNIPMNKGIFDSEEELRNLSGTLEQASLKCADKTRPKHFSDSDRLSTIDKFAMDLMTPLEPIDLESRSRSSTLDALLDFDNDPLLIRPDFERQSSSRLSIELPEDTLARPSLLDKGARLTTMDFLDIINEPSEKDDEEPSKPLELNREVSVSEWLNDDM